MHEDAYTGLPVRPVLHSPVTFPVCDPLVRLIVDKICRFCRRLLQLVEPDLANLALRPQNLVLVITKRSVKPLICNSRLAILGLQFNHEIKKVVRDAKVMSTDSQIRGQGAFLKRFCSASITSEFESSTPLQAGHRSLSHTYPLVGSA